jgi:asparagine synthase (glutamine-hydrolysing)
VCGIVGILAFEGAVPYPERWPDLVNHLQHRGPDEGAYWSDGPFFLGSRRLSIIDLKTGGQPMASDDGALMVVHNGEIYNYLELRDTLRGLGCEFRTESDTEVLLHGYRVWGPELPARLSGMFAFAVADRRRQALFVARDRLGEKPLFYTVNRRRVAFASELRPLATLPDLDRRLDTDGLGGFLCLNYVPGTRTLLTGVHRLEPGAWKEWSAAGTRGGAYWRLPVPGEAEAPPAHDGGEDGLAARVDHAVKLCLRSDVPVGIFLSGGVDSSVVAESAARQGRLATAYVLDFDEPGFSELRFAKTVADRLGLPLERVVLTPRALGDFVRLVDHADDPLADSSALAVWELSREAARTTKVVLTGDGGDEVFGGYLTYLATRLHQRLTPRLPRAAARALARAGARLPTSEGKVTRSYKAWRFLRALDLPSGEAHLSWNGTWLPAQAAALVTPGPLRETVAGALREVADRLGLSQRADLAHLQRADLAEYLPNDILAKTDRMSMAHGLECRAPLLAPDLVEWALGLPERARIGPGGRTKPLLRRLAARHYGADLGDRPKQGFSIPVHRWVRGPLREMVRDLLSPASVARLAVLDPLAVDGLVEDHFEGRRSYGFELWGLAVLVAWHRLRIERAPDPPVPRPLSRRAVALRPA